MDKCPRCKGHCGRIAGCISQEWEARCTQYVVDVLNLQDELATLRERLSVAEEAINSEVLHHAGALLDIPAYLESDPYCGEAYAKERRYHAARQSQLEGYRLAIGGERTGIAHRDQ
jgi:hypothetical protein